MQKMRTAREKKQSVSSNQNNNNNNNSKTLYDVCIVGGGPSGLATLSALCSPYSLDSTTMDMFQANRAVQNLHHAKKQNVVVVDAEGEGSAKGTSSSRFWMTTWQHNFKTLGIKYLRSPVMAHPDLFDPHSLLSFAVEQDRLDELLESGCFDMKHLLPLAQTQVGLWKLPSTKLFADFCHDLATRLPHKYVGNFRAVDITAGNDNDLDGDQSPTCFHVISQTGETIRAKAIVLALGPVGRPIVPPSILKAPRWRFWNETGEQSTDRYWDSNGYPTLVLGGGLTAVQVALQIVENSTRTPGARRPYCLLCSKRPLVEKHFDIPVEWFDRRTTNKCMADFYHHPMTDRIKALKEARDGGSVPPIYMRRVEAAQRSGHLQCLVGQAEYCHQQEDNDVSRMGMRILIHQDQEERDPTSSKRKNRGEQEQSLKPTSSSWVVREIVVACGVTPSIMSDDELDASNEEKSSSSSSTLLERIQSQWPTEIAHGFPCVTEDLRWNPDVNIFCVGSLGALSIGPDAGNLMGIRRAAQLVANALEVRSWLHETAVLKNPFDTLLSSSSDDDDSDTDSSTSSSSCP